MRLWLRVDPRLPAARIAAEAVAALRPRIAERGGRLLQVVCNGRVEWPRPEPEVAEARAVEPFPTTKAHQEVP